MASETVKGRPLTKEETKFLLELIEASKIITTKCTNATNNKLKNEEWIRLADRFNSTTNFLRTPQQLRLKWENLKKNARKRSTLIRMNQIKTGGGPPDYVPPDAILDIVSSLLGSTVSGFSVQFGGDRESAGFVVVGGDGESTINGGGGDDAHAQVDGSIGSSWVSTVPLNETTVSMPNEKNIETVATDYHVLDVVDQNVITPNKSKRLMISTPRAVRKKCKPDESRTARNTALAEYYALKKHCLDAKLTNINLENDYLKLKNSELKLNNEKLSLEIERLKLEIEKSKQK